MITKLKTLVGNRVALDKINRVSLEKLWLRKEMLSDICKCIINYIDMLCHNCLLTD